MDIPRELIEQFITLTNAAEPLASQLLSDSNLDVNAAVSSFFAIQDAGGVPPTTSPGPHSTEAQAGASTAAGGSDAEIAAALAAMEESEQVRAPIPQLVDTLLPSRGPRRNQAVVDPFTTPSSGGGDDRLAEIFRPPADLIFSGSLEDAMSEGVREKRWVLVTIHQSDVFQCQVLNRDVWKNSYVQNLLRAYFIFWQRDLTSEDGTRYRQYYPFSDSPHIAIIDPRTSERVFEISGPTGTFEADEIIRILTDFTDTNSLDTTDPVRRPAVLGAESSRQRPSASAAAAPAHQQNNLEDLADAEDAQLAAAIAASMETAGTDAPNENGDVGAPILDNMDVDNSAVSREVSRQLSASNPTLNRDRSLRAQQDSEYEASLAMDRAKELSMREEEARVKRVQEKRDAKRNRVPPEPPAGTPNVTELVVRLPNNERLKRRFLVNHTIGDVYDFVETQVDALADEEFDLMTPYPKKTFSDRTMLISDAGLSTRALLVVHVR